MKTQYLWCMLKILIAFHTKKTPQNMFIMAFFHIRKFGEENKIRNLQPLEECTTVKYDITINFVELGIKMKIEKWLMLSRTDYLMNCILEQRNEIHKYVLIYPQDI